MKGRDIYSIRVLVGIVLCLSCSSGQDSSYLTIDCLSAQVGESGNWGFIGRDGQVILENEFEEEPSPVVDGVFSVEEDEGYTVFRLTGDNYERIDGLTGLAKVGYMQNGLLPVCREGERIMVVNTDGKKQFELVQFYDQEVESCESYSEGFMPVWLADGTKLYVNTQGQDAFGRRFAWCGPFRNGFAVVGELKEGEEDDPYEDVCVINTDGDIVCHFNHSIMPDESASINFMEKLYSGNTRKDRCVIYRFDGEELLRCPSDVRKAVLLLEDCFVYESDDGERGLMDYSGKQLIQPDYEQLVPLGGEYFLGVLDSYEEKIRILDRNNEKVGTLDGEKVVVPQMFFMDFPKIVDTAYDGMYLIDSKGKRLNEKSVRDISTLELEEGKFGEVENLYVPLDSIVNTLCTLTHNGVGTPMSYGINFNHCTPSDIPYIKSKPTSRFEGVGTVQMEIAKGFGYEITMALIFNAPVVEKGKNVLNSQARIDNIMIYVKSDKRCASRLIEQEFSKRLEKEGCAIIAQKNDRFIRRLYSGKTGENLILCRSQEYSFEIWLSEKSEQRVAIWKLLLNHMTD